MKMNKDEAQKKYYKDVCYRHARNGNAPDIHNDGDFYMDYVANSLVYGHLEKGKKGICSWGILRDAFINTWGFYY